MREYALIQLLYGLAINSITSEYHFKTIVVGRIMTAGDHNSTGRSQSVGRKVQHGRSDHTHINHIHTRGLQAFS